MWVWEIRCQNCSIPCPILATFVHIFSGSVSEGLSVNHHNIGCELHRRKPDLNEFILMNH